MLCYESKKCYVSNYKSKNIKVVISNSKFGVEMQS